MPEWTTPPPERPKMNAADALKTLKDSKDGESGVIELEGEDVLEFISGLFGNGEGVPDSLSKLLSGVGEGTVVAKVINKRDLPELTEEMQETLTHHASVRAEDDDRFWDAQRKVGEGDTSYREMKQMAEFALANPDSKAVVDESAMKAFAHVVLYLLEKQVAASNLIREAHRVITTQGDAISRAKEHLEEYQTHMVTEHGVAPDGM